MFIKAIVITAGEKASMIHIEPIPEPENCFSNLDFEIISRATDHKSSYEIPMNMETKIGFGMSSSINRKKKKLQRE